MGEIEDAIERADRESFTRQPPKTLKGQIRYLLKQMGSAKAVAQELGVTADSVNRYRRGARKHARADVAAKIDDAVRSRWQPQVRKRRREAGRRQRDHGGDQGPVRLPVVGRIDRRRALPPSHRPSPRRVRAAPLRRP